MTSKIFIFLLATGVFFSCAAPSYLSRPENVDTNPYGAFIKISKKAGPSVEGELISVDSNIVILKTEGKTKDLIVTPKSEVSHFKVLYAKPKNYGWTILAGIIVPLIPVPIPGETGSSMPMHGFYSVISIPVNMLVTIPVVVSSYKELEYTDKEINYYTLKMFARFPQGIPPQIELKRIK
jgi:hypothetical protein